MKFIILGCIGIWPEAEDRGPYSNVKMICSIRPHRDCVTFFCKSHSLMHPADGALEKINEGSKSMGE